MSRLDLSACLLSHSLSSLRELRQLRPLGTFDQTHTADSPAYPSLALLGAHTLKVFNKSSRGAIVCRADRFEEGPSKILGSSSRLGIGENQFYEKKKKKDRECPRRARVSLMQDGSPSPIVCTRLAQWSEHDQKLLKNESSSAALQQKIIQGFLGLESEKRN